MAKNKKWAWRAEYIAYRGIECVFKLIPVSVCYRFGSLLGTVGHKFVHTRRRTVMRNLRIAFGHEKSKSEIEQLTKEVFQTTTANLLASIKTAVMSRRAVEQCLTVEGADLVEQYAEANNGAVMLLPHMGNWEIGARISEIHFPDLPYGGMYRPLNNPYIDKVVKKRREISGSKLFARNDGMAAPLNLIRSKGLLGILADQRVGKAGQITPFFGRLTSFSPLPQIFKKRTKCSVLGLAIFSTTPGKWTARFTLEADKDTDLNTGDVAAIMEKLMRLSPKDCFWLQDRWRLERQPLALAGKTPIIKPQIHQAPVIKQNFAIYIDKMDNKMKLAISLLETHRPDVRIISLVSEKADITQPPTQNFTTCPDISNQSEFIQFIENNDEEQYLDIILVPQSFTAEKPQELLSTFVTIDYTNILKSLEEAGLPQTKIQ